MKNLIQTQTLIGIAVMAAIASSHSLVFSHQKQNLIASNDIPAGLELRPDKNPYKWQGDFDNDSITDSLYVVEITPLFQANSSIIVLDVWNGMIPQSNVNKSLALLLKGSRNQQSYLFRNDSYFNSPIWRESTLPVAIIEKTHLEHSDWQKQIEGLKGDGIILGTEAGIDTLLYWDGTSFRLYLPNEEP